MAFHRLTVPSYFGGLPGGYDYINNAISGTPAFADGQKGSGPNVGTYFVAFGEDATSSDANRSNKALAQNTDALDDTLHRDIALPIRSGDTGPTGSPTASVTLTGPGIFLGNVGAALVDLFHVTDSNDDDIDVGGTKVLVTSITGGTVGSGFSTGNITIIFNISIPTGSTYRVYYATRTNFATFPSDGLTSTRIRGAVDVDAQVEELFRLLHGNGEAWNAAWDSTIWDLTARGLDGSYRRSTTGVAGTFNVAGSGATITRDGAAPNASSAISTRIQPDEFMGAWASHLADQGALRTSGALGSWGYVVDGTRWQTRGENFLAPSIGSFLSVWRRGSPQISGTPGSGLGYWTYLPSGATGTVTSLGNGQYRIVLASGGAPYFWKADTGTSGNPKRTAIALGQDMLSFTSAGKAVAAIIMSLTTSDSTGRTAVVTALDGGSIPGYDPGPTSVTNVQWISPLFYHAQGPRARNALDNVLTGQAYGIDGLFCVIPPRTVDRNTVDASYVQYVPAGPTAYFGLATTEDSPVPALAWGAFDQTDLGGTGGQWKQNGILYSDGGVQGSRYFHNAQALTVTGSNQNVTLNAALFDTFYIQITGDNTTFANIFVTGLVSTSFERIRIIFDESAHNAQINGRFVWGTNVVFNSGTSAFLRNLPGTFDVFDLEVINGSFCLATNNEARGKSGALQALNFQPPVNPPGGIGSPYAICWNDSNNSPTSPGSQRWLLLTFTSGSDIFGVYYGTGQDSVWTFLGSFNVLHVPTAMCVDSAGTIWVTVILATGANTAAHYFFPSGVPGTPTQVAFSLTGCTDYKIAPVGNHVVGALGSSTGGAAELFQVTTSGITLGTSGLTANQWILKSNGRIAVAVPLGNNGNQFYTTTDGITWNLIDISSQLGGGFLQIDDIAWSEELGYWLMTCFLSAGPSSHVSNFTATNLAVWTQVGPNLVSVTPIVVAAVGKVWVALAPGRISQTVEVLMSYDGGHWYTTPNVLVSSDPAFTYILAQSPTALAAACGNTTSQVLTRTMRFSLAEGIPDQILT